MCFEFEASPTPGMVQAKATLAHGPYVLRVYGVARSYEHALTLLVEAATLAHANLVNATRPPA